MFNTPPFRHRPHVSSSNPCVASFNLPCYPFNNVDITLTRSCATEEDTVAAWASAITALDALPLLYELAALVALHTADATPNRGRLGILRAKYEALAERATNSNATLLRGLRSRMLLVPEVIPPPCQAGQLDNALPEGIPAPPEGWMYWGKRPLDNPAVAPSADIALYVGSIAQWDFTRWRGFAGGNIYAVRLGSEIALANGLSVAPPAPGAGPPAEAPPVPEGFAYWGSGALTVLADGPHMEDVRGWANGNEWSGPMYGASDTNHHCLRIGSAIAVANGIPTPEIGPVVMPMATPPTIPAPPAGFLLYGAGPLAVLPNTADKFDVLGYGTEDDEHWTTPCAGTRADWHYALRAGSSIALANGLA